MKPSPRHINLSSGSFRTTLLTQGPSSQNQRVNSIPQHPTSIRFQTRDPSRLPLGPAAGLVSQDFGGLKISPCQSQAKRRVFQHKQNNPCTYENLSISFPVSVAPCPRVLWLLRRDGCA